MSLRRLLLQDQGAGECVEKRYTYCFYKSPLGRVLQEQLRNQLYPGGTGFGTAKDPACEGFTIEEFSKVDWSKIDLSEWIAMATGGGFMGADIEKLTLEALTGKGGPQDWDGNRLNAIERTLQRFEGIDTDEIRKDIEEKTILFPGGSDAATK